MLAVTRLPSPDMSHCALSHIARKAIDSKRTALQHARYRTTLESLGCRVIVLPSERDMPDAVFVEDTAIVVEEVAVLTRPCLEARRRETPSMRAALSPYRPIETIEAPATIEGGDVVRAGRTLWIGESERSSADGVEQLREILAPHGYDVRTAPLRDCLHLKTAATWIGNDTVLLNPRWTDASAFEGLQSLEVDPEEPWAANTVLVGGTVLASASCPRTIERLRREGFAVAPVENDELAKAEGGLSCQSILLGDTR